ncbi:dermonecrotic toxin domain-containing protein [Pseudomonas sp. NPDC090233]|uniref:dermonecrotic toxin domain-containing protein n=1 Tax=Pseudomonas sp. NPDC090233 TaxID=3364479 RepID=UPI00383A3B59
MGDIEKATRNLEALDAARPLVRLVNDIVRDYPDPYVLASQHAARILRKHTGREMDPRFVWWHQFNNEQSSPRAFTGWEHSGPPQKSLLMHELMVDRFDLYYQESSDELDQRGGFYRQGPHAKVFDERNEVPMLGSKVQADLWALDFAVLYRAEVQRFWSTYGADFRVLAKINLLGRGAKALQSGAITSLDWARLRALAADNLPVHQLPTLEALRRNATHNSLSVNRYVFGEGDRCCLFSLVAPDGRILAYMPWAEEAVKAFDSEAALASWLCWRLQSNAGLEAFVSGAHSSPRDSAAKRLIKVHLRGIAASRSDEAALIALSLFKRPLSLDLFTYLVHQAELEMKGNAQLMQDNAGLRKAMLSGYLSAFLSVFGGLAPLGWPISLMLLGASVGKVALDVDVATHASDEQSRKQALRAAMFESVFASMNLLDISFQSSFAALSYEAPPHEAGVSLTHWQLSDSRTLSMEVHEGNTVLTGEAGQAGRLRGVHVNDDGSCWIRLDGLPYRVRYDHELAIWLVVAADNPFAFSPLHPVRLNEAGEWELLAPPRLLAGAPTAVAGMPNASSSFWDIYTVVNEPQSKQLSAYALARQKALLKKWPIAELERGRSPDLDARGMDCVIVGGRTYYSYRYGNEYFNTLIEYYTSDESKVNDVFRYGTYHFGDEDNYLTDLADSMDRLPKNNQVSLYRGGHQSRGTSGERYRKGELRVGDVLVNTDLASFSENPYKAVEFACLPNSDVQGGLRGTFDDSSVVFELPPGEYQQATPISAFSLYWDEAETLLLPGNYFRIDALEQVYGEHYRFVKVTLKKTAKPTSGPVYDLRTGLPFDMEAYRARINKPSLVNRFFPD